MAQKWLLITIVTLLVAAGGVRAAELSVTSLAMRPDSTTTVVVSGDIAGESTFGVTILVELVAQGGNTGTLEFTPALPVDIVQLGDPWPGLGTFSPFDTDPGGTNSPVLNGSIDDGGSVPAPVTYSGSLTGFPVIA